MKKLSLSTNYGTVKIENCEFNGEKISELVERIFSPGTDLNDFGDIHFSIDSRIGNLKVSLKDLDINKILSDLGTPPHRLKEAALKKMNGLFEKNGVRINDISVGE